MARIVLTLFGSHGDLNPYLALGKGLKARGHRVVVATTSLYRADTERAGLEFFPVRPRADSLDRAMYAKIMDRMRGSEFIVKKLMMPSLRETYADLEQASQGADLLISHVICYAAPVLAQKKNMPWLSVALCPMIFFSAHDPPMLAPLPWLHAFSKAGPRVNGFLLGALKKISYSWTHPVRALRAELGLDPGRDPLFEGQHSPHGVLGLFSQSFAQPQPDWPERVRICGFPFLDESAEPDEELERFLADGPPPVAFAMGSSAVHIAEALHKEAIAAARALNCRMVITAGPHKDALRAAGLPKNVLAVGWASYNTLFPKCRAIVHQGGVGTTAEALRSGRPMLVAPFAHDQFDNAMRVERMGAGLRISRNFSARGLVSALKRLESEPGFWENAQKASAIIRAENGINAACDVVEEVLRSVGGKG